MIDYGRVEWDVVKKQRKTCPARFSALLKRFKDKRARHEIFATIVNGKPVWRPHGPTEGFIFEPP